MIFKINIYTIAAALSALYMPSTTLANQTDCVTSFNPKADYFPDKVQVKYNSGFDITYKGNSKHIRNNISGETYILYQCGTPIPNDAQPTPANSSQVGGWTKVMAVPGTKVVLDSAPASAIIELLGVQNSVAASYEHFAITSPCMQKAISALPRVQQNFGTPKARRSRIDHVPRVFYDLAMEELQWTFTTYGMSDPHSIAVNPENASDMLGKAEWIKFVAAFYNKEARANDIFDQIEARYNSIKRSAANGSKRTVGFARYSKVANGTVTGWTIDQPQQWMVQGLADAGLNVHSGDMASFKSVDDFYKAVSGWDVLIDLSSEPLPHGGATIPEWSNLVEGYKFSTNNKVAKSLPFFASNSIYRSDLISSYQNATDFSEHLQVQPDDLLSDFVKLATASLGAKDTKWYRNMPGKVSVHWVSSADCNN